MERKFKQLSYIQMMPEIWRGPIESEAGDGISEVILRRDQPIVLREKSGIRKLLPVVSGADLEAYFYRLCNWSMHACQETLRRGYITLRDGCRVGVAGEASVEQGRITAVGHVQSLHLRSACAVPGCSDPVREQAFCSGYTGLLLAGAPGTGKTTILRDLCASLAADGASVAVVDARRELQHAQLSGCDLLLGYPKGAGAEIALRCLAPDFICVDELCTPQEAEQLRISASGGAYILAAVHGCSFEELFHRPVLQSLFAGGCFGAVVLLETGRQGAVRETFLRRPDGSWSSRT